MQTVERMRLRGDVRVMKYDAESGLLLSDNLHHNTATNWARAVIASLLITAPNTENTVFTLSRPLYISLGTGTQTPSNTDLAMFSETYGMRIPISYTSSLQAFVAQFSANYQTTDPNGTFYEAGLWDSNVSTVTLGAVAEAGQTSITLSGSTPAVNGSTIPGQYNTIYISDGENSEYASIATTATAGATTWQLQNGLQYAHASGAEYHGIYRKLMGTL